MIITSASNRFWSRSLQVLAIALVTVWGGAQAGAPQANAANTPASAGSAAAPEGSLQADESILRADIPKATYEALKLNESASPQQLYDALVKRYHDPAQGAGPGTLAKYWTAIPFTKYMDPADYYKPPNVHVTAKRGECIACHTGVTPEWVRQWKMSDHANLDKIRALTPNDPTYWKKQQLEQVEANLRSEGKLAQGQQLKEVSCIDCHVAVNDQKTANHFTDLHLPTADTCGQCHLKEFAEAESERDSLTWPKNPIGQPYPDGRPSMALSWKAVAETPVWAAMPQREIAEGCTQCHYTQNKCDGCHTRHQFSTVVARKPEACETCHYGVDHQNFAAYMHSKHGVLYASQGSTWNWNARLKDAFTKGGYTAPTCQTCHMEYNGKYTHNFVRKVRWANYPMVPGVMWTIEHTPWAKARKADWVETCSQCHSPRFAESYLTMMDKGTEEGVAKGRVAYDVVQKLYDDKLLPGQLTNRPAPPAPMKDGAHVFFQKFWTEGNNPSWADIMGVHLYEDNTSKLHVALAHVDPGGWTYSAGWQQLNLTYTKIMNENERLRSRAALEKRVAALEGKQQRISSVLDLDNTGKRVAFGGLGGAMLLGGIALIGWRRRDRKDD